MAPHFRENLEVAPGDIAGVEDSRDDALAYIRHTADGRELDPSFIEVFVNTVTTSSSTWR